MPIVPFETLPDDARIWVFGSDRPVTGEAAGRLLAEVDDFLAQWKAHGEPLSCSRRWDDDRFLIIGVNQEDAHASGCSIDGLFRRLQALEPVIGARLLGGGRVYYRDASGMPRSVERSELRERAAAGDLTPATPVFDVGVTSLGDWRTGFERPASETWVGPLLAR
jgi:hypothetical protein